MSRLDFTYSDLNLPAFRSRTRRASISGVQEKVQLKRVRGGFEVVEAGGDYILTPAYDFLNPSIHFPNEPSATGLEFFADGRYTPAYERLGFYSSEDFVELGKCFGVPERNVCRMLGTFGERRRGVEGLVSASSLSMKARGRYLDKFNDRLLAITQ